MGKRRPGDYLPGRVPIRPRRPAIHPLAEGRPTHGGRRPGQMAMLAPIYAALANGNSVQAEVHGTGKGRIRGVVLGSEVIDQATGQDLPFVNITATASTGRNAFILAQRTIQSLQAWVTAQQASTQTAPAQRIQLQVVKSGSPAKLVAKPKLTTPLLVLVAGMVGIIALALIRENLWPETAARLGRLLTAVRPRTDIMIAATSMRPEGTLYGSRGRRGR